MGYPLCVGVIADVVERGLVAVLLVVGIREIGAVLGTASDGIGRAEGSTSVPPSGVAWIGNKRAADITLSANGAKSVSLSLEFVSTVSRGRGITTVGLSTERSIPGGAVPVLAERGSFSFFIIDRIFPSPELPIVGDCSD